MGKIDHNKCMELYRQGLGDLKIAEVQAAAKRMDAAAAELIDGALARKDAKAVIAAEAILSGEEMGTQSLSVEPYPTIKPEPSAFRDGEIRLSDSTGPITESLSDGTGPAVPSEATTAGAIRQSLDERVKSIGEQAEVTMLLSDLRQAMAETVRTAIAELAGHTDRLTRQILFLRGVAVGAGIRNINELLDGIR